jgi:hypothetical protein
MTELPHQLVHTSQQTCTVLAVAMKTKITFIFQLPLDRFKNVKGALNKGTLK